MKRVLVTGSGGFLGSHIAAALEYHGFSVVGTSRGGGNANGSSGQREIAHIDLTDAAFIDIVEDISPDAIVHAAAMADIRACEERPELAHTVNVAATAALAQWCAPRDARFIFISTDQVFDGAKSWYRENDEPNPIHMYGRTKAEAELSIDASNPHNTIARVSLVYGRSPSGRRSASEQVVNMLRAGQNAQLFTDEFRTPIFVVDVSSAIVELMHARNHVQLIHLAGPDRVSRYDLGVAIAHAHHMDATCIQGLRQNEVDLQPPRPKDLSLDTSLARRVLKHLPRSLHKGLSALVQQESS